MTDIADAADAAIDAEMRDALSHKRPQGPEPCGACHFCGQDLAPGLRWCDAECREDWERIQIARKRNGS